MKNKFESRLKNKFESHSKNKFESHSKNKFEGHSKNKFEGHSKNKFENILNQELKKNKVKVKTWNKENEGLAWTQDREIAIPRPKSRVSLMWGLHEIGHVVLRHIDGKRRYEEEYEAEMWAISKAKEYGITSRRYEMTAKAYVFHQIAEAMNRGHRIEDIPKDIYKWLNIELSSYQKDIDEGYRLQVPSRQFPATIKEIEIFTYLPIKKEISTINKSRKGKTIKD